MAILLAVLSVGAIIIASLASYTHSGFANAQQNKTSMQSSLTVEQARRIVTPLYEALNEPTKKDVPALLANRPTLTTNPVRPTRIVCRVIN